MSKDIDTIKLSDKCKLEINKGGLIKICGNCDGEEINRTELKIFDRTIDITEDEL